MGISKVIGVEGNLGNVRQALEAEGFRTINLDDPGINQAAALVTSGIEENLLGMNTTSTKAPVFSARGKSASEVVREIQQRLQH